MTSVEHLRRARLLIGAALCLCLLTLLAACSRPPQLQTLEGRTMGTYWQVRLAAGATGTPLPVLRAEIEAVLEAVNAEMSTYREDSVITRFNRAEAGEAVDLPEGFVRVLAAALALADQTEGAYDPTVGPLVNLWGFGPDGLREVPPEPEAIEQARARVGWQRLTFEPAQRYIVQPGGLYLDLSSIAKGDAVDRVLELLQHHRIDSAMVDIGGDLRTLGQRPDGSPWRIGIERPVPGSREVQSVLLLPRPLAVATSGSYRNFFEHGARAFSHTIDPRSGVPVQHALVSVTVLADTCLEADAWATALGVLGPEKGFDFARQRGLAVLFITADADQVREIATPAMQSLLGAIP
ncbi:MAG: FAD:protein FMN transferase [Aquimonas sp.]|nr:FAD:protein FMN transferase [Aquimonas sp.]